MFEHGVPPVTYVHPWTQPFEDRFAALRRAGTRVAYYYHEPDSSTFRYRCYNMAQAVNALLPGVSAAHFVQEDGSALDRVVDAADILVVCRARYTDRLNRLITRARGLGRRVIYDIDDLVFDTRFAHQVLTTLDQEPSDAAMDHWFAYFGRLGATMRLCDQVTVTNQQLAARVEEFAACPTRVIPNFMNREQLEVSERVLNAKRASGFRSSGPVLLGYFSGTPTHNRDFGLIAPTLARLLDSDERLGIRLVGFLDDLGPLARHRARISHAPLQDFVNLQRLIGEVELNLVPLQDNAFTNCKSNLKYFEAGVTGTVTVASTTIPYCGAIEDGRNAFLARTQAWEETLTRALAALDEYACIAERACEHSLAHYGWQVQANALEAALLAPCPPPTSRKDAHGPH